MKKYKPFSRKYYTEDLKDLARAIVRCASYYGARVHDSIEGRNHENEAWRFGGDGSMGFESEDFVYRVYIHRKSRKEKLGE